MCLAYLQIGIMQALAGFYAWMLVLNDYGFPPVVLIGNPGATAPTGKLGFFADQVMYCKYNGGARAASHESGFFVDFESLETARSCLLSGSRPQGGASRSMNHTQASTGTPKGKSILREETRPK